MGGVLSLGSLREASCLGFFSLFGHRLKGGVPGASDGWERVWEGQGRGAPVLKRVCSGVSLFISGRLGFWHAARSLWELSRVLKGTRREFATLELSWVLKGAALGPMMERRLGSAEGSLE